MLTLKAHLKKGDKAKHKWDSDGIVKKTIGKKKVSGKSAEPKTWVILELNHIASSNDSISFVFQCIFGILTAMHDCRSHHSGVEGPS